MKIKRGSREKRFDYLVFSLIFILLIAINVNANVSHDSSPTIRLTFDEAISLGSVTAEVFCDNDFGDCYENFDLDGIVLARGNGIDVSLENNNDGDNRVVVYDLDILINDYYVLETTIEDLFGNEATEEFHFQVDAEYMDIHIIEPEDGWSSSETFDVVISPEEEGICLYKPGHENIPTNPTTDIFDENYIVSGNRHYKIIDATTKHESYIFNNQLPLSVVCYSDNGFYGFEEITINWDTTAPVITYFSDPNPLTDISFPYAIIKAESEHDEIGCSIMKLIHDGEPVTNPEFVNFNGIDTEDISTYNQTNSYLVDFANILDDTTRFDPHNFQYEISCRNKAGLYDTNNIVDLVVQFSEQFNIEQINPSYEGYVNYNDVDVKIRTQVLTNWCNISKEGEFNNEMLQDDNQKDYNYTLPGLLEGNYVYDVNCFSSFGSRSNKQLRFGVDKTKPDNLSINTNLYTCSLNKIEFEMSANDDLSGIDYFTYAIYNPDLGILDEGETTGSVSYSTTLVENKTYRIEGVAFDKAGNSRVFQSRTVTATTDDLLECDFIPPTVRFNVNEEQGLTTVNISCSDSETGCKNNFEYSLLTDVSAVCTYDSLGYWDTNNQFLFSEKTKVCVIAYDNNNNEVETNEIINVDTSVVSHCLNSIQDFDESDVDCGGMDCAGCDSGLICLIDGDCISGWCQEGICADSACDDSIFNGDESDVDCGGSCSQCSEGSACINNEDCTTMWCNENICEKSSCSDGLYNGFESDIDCGGLDCSGCPNGFECTDSGDCLSGYCDYGTCNDEPSPAPTESIKESNVLALILLILGILFILGGAVYLVYYFYFVQPISKSEAKPSFHEVAKIKKLTPGQIAILKKKHDLMKVKFKQKAKSAKNKISSSLSSFDNASSYAEKDKEKAKASILKNIPKEKKNLQTKETTKLDKNLRGDYVELDKLDNTPKKSIKKQLKENTIFDMLSKIRSSPKKQDNKENTLLTKKYITEEDFKKLDNLMGKAIKSSNTTKAKTLTAKPLLNQVEVKEKKEDIFAALSELADKSSKSKAVSSKNNLFESEDLIELFKNKELDVNVFKVILSELLRTSKLSNKDVSNIIFRLLEKKLIAKDVAHTILKDLKLVND